MDQDMQDSWNQKGKHKSKQKSKHNSSALARQVRETQKNMVNNMERVEPKRAAKLCKKMKYKFK
jgi:hypothetical protein